MQYDTAVLCNERDISEETIMPSLPSKILVVEDNLLNQKVIRILLEDLGYIVDIAENGQRALALFNAEYSMILMDVGLPDIDGCDVCAQIRQSESGKDVPIVALTANGEIFKARCTDAGMDFYLTKPIMLEDLKNMLKYYDL